MFLAQPLSTMGLTGLTCWIGRRSRLQSAEKSSLQEDLGIEGSLLVMEHLDMEQPSFSARFSYPTFTDFSDTKTHRLGSSASKRTHVFLSARDDLHTNTGRRLNVDPLRFANSPTFL